MPGKSIGTVVSNALLGIGEPTITEFDSVNILQLQLIDEANNTRIHVTFASISRIVVDQPPGDKKA